MTELPQKNVKLLNSEQHLLMIGKVLIAGAHFDKPIFNTVNSPKN
jgi:hypothetical protein